VRNAVASVINQGGVGEAIAFSHITGAADDVAGVIASAVVSPTYNSTSDTIPVGAFERPLVLDLKNDIQIAFVGE
jgi:uncharacterized phage protein gp47/JayE